MRRKGWRDVGGAIAIPLIGGLGITLILVFIVAVFVRSSALLESAAGLETLARLFGRRDYYVLIFDTLYFGVVTTATATLFGVALAWLTERTDLPGRSFIRILMTVGILIPGFFTAMGWLFLAHPRIGMVNTWLSESLGLTVNIQTIPGMGLIQGLALATLSYVVAAPSLSAVDPVLEESAEAHGLGLWTRLTTITLPVVAPALVAGALLTFMVSLAVFDIPAVLGMSSKIILFSTYTYNLLTPTDSLPRYDVAAAAAAPMLLLAVGLSVAYYRVVRQSHRYQVISGKGYRSKRASLPRSVVILSWMFVSTYLFLAILLPLLTLIWISGLPYFRPVSVEAFALLSLKNYVGLLTSSLWSSAANTLIFSTVAPTITVAISLAISWVITRRKGRASRWFEIVAFLPMSIPSAVFAVGAITMALAMGSFLPIYGTIGLIIIVEAAIRISVATRITNSAMLQIHNELDEAGSVFGLSVLTRYTRILIPLLMPALAFSWFFLALLAFRELTVPALLVSRSNVTLSVYTWGLLSTGNYGRASALTILVIISILVFGLVTVAANSAVVHGRQTGARR